MRLDEWIRAHKPQTAAGAAAGLAGVVYLVKRRQAASGGSTASPFALPATGGGTVGTTPYDSSGNDVYNSLQPILEGLQNEVDQLSTVPPITQTIPVTAPPVTGPVATGISPGDIGGMLPPGAVQGGNPPTSAEKVQQVGGQTIVTPAAAPTPSQTFSQLTSFQGLPAGTALFTKNADGSYSWLSPAEAAAVKPGTAFYVQGNDNKAPK